MNIEKEIKLDISNNVFKSLIQSKKRFKLKNKNKNDINNLKLENKECKEMINELEKINDSYKEMTYELERKYDELRIENKKYKEIIETFNY